MPYGQQRVTTTTHSVINDPILGIAHQETSTVNGVLVSTRLRESLGYSTRTLSLGRSSLTTRSIPTNGAWTVSSTFPDNTRNVETYTDGLLVRREDFDTTGASLHFTTYLQNGFGRLLSTTDSRTGTSTMGLYLENGALNSVTDPGNRLTSFTYDKMGRRTAIDLPDTLDATGATLVNVTHTSYYPTGQIAAVWGDQTNATFRVYDERNRMTELRTYRSLAHNAQPVKITPDYDATTWAYHPQRGFLVAKRDAADKGADFTYTNAGRLKTRLWARGILTIYAYSPTDGRLATVGRTDVAPVSFSYAYTPNSNLIESVTGPAHTVINTWDTSRDVLWKKENNIVNSSPSTYDYNIPTHEVNAIGQRVSVTQAGTAFKSTRRIDWGYDSLGQVTRSDHSADNNFDRGYLYDSIGNRRGQQAGATAVPVNAQGVITPKDGTTTYAANSLNQYDEVGTLVPGYDDDGNATAYPLPVAPASNSTLKWDAENRLVSTVVTGVTTSYQYDAFSRRVSKSTGGSKSIFVYDGFNCVAEYNGTTSTLTKTYLWGIDLSGTMQGAGGVGGLLTVQAGSDVHFPAYDGNGNISEYLTANGTVAAHFEYDPFGNLLVDTYSNKASFPYRFSTKPQDAETGLYYYSYRYYDPMTGRWMSRDTIGERGGLNVYELNYNCSINWFDYLGREPTQRNLNFDITRDSSVPAKLGLADRSGLDSNKKFLSDKVSECCKKFSIGCDVKPHFKEDLEQPKNESPSDGYGRTGKSLDNYNNNAGKSGNGSIPILLTHAPIQGGDAYGLGAAGGGIVMTPRAPGYTLAHESGHSNGYDKGDQDSNHHNSQEDSLMNRQGGNNVDECWCKKMSGAAK